MFTNTLLPNTFRAIQLARSIPEVQKAYLAGGTSLALQIGHRISVDLDFFTLHEFNEKEVSKKLASHKEFVEKGTSQWTIWGELSKAKFSMFYYKYPLLEATIPFEGIQLASLKDIAAMKIHAIETRGTKRNFVDVYFLSKNYTLDEMLEFYEKKYAVLEEHLYAVLRSLDYFEDAEHESEMPQMIAKVDWEEVKEYFRQQTRLLAQKNL